MLPRLAPCSIACCTMVMRSSAARAAGARKWLLGLQKTTLAKADSVDWSVWKELLKPFRYKLQWRARKLAVTPQQRSQWIVVVKIKCDPATL